MRRAIPLVFCLSLFVTADTNLWAHGGGGGGGGGGHGGGGGFGGGGHGGGFGGGGGHYGGGGMYGGHSMGGMYGGGGYYGGGHSMGGVYSGGGLSSGHVGSSAIGSMHSGALNAGGLGQHHSGFVHNYAGSMQGHTVNHSGNFANNYSHHNHQSPQYWQNRSYFFGFGSPFGFYLGYPWWWSGYGNRYGYGGYGGYGFGGYGGYYGGYYGYNPYGYGNGNYGYQAIYPYAGYGAAGTATVAVQDQTAPTDDQLQSSLDFASQGEVSFKAGKYDQAVQNWRHALVDDPRNGAILLLLGQALFAQGKYDEAAGATQAALQMVPQDKWGTVVTHYKELYTNIQNYTDQIRAAEKARDATPDDPAIHFLLGYHFGYLNFPKEAVRELNKTLATAPKDEVAKKLRDEFAAKLPADSKSSDTKPADDKADDKSGDKTNGTET